MTTLKRSKPHHPQSLPMYCCTLPRKIVQNCMLWSTQVESNQPRCISIFRFLKAKRKLNSKVIFNMFTYRKCLWRFLRKLFRNWTTRQIVLAERTHLTPRLTSNTYIHFSLNWIERSSDATSICNFLQCYFLLHLWRTQKQFCDDDILRSWAFSCHLSTSSNVHEDAEMWFRAVLDLQLFLF